MPGQVHQSKDKDAIRSSNMNQPVWDEGKSSSDPYAEMEIVRNEEQISDEIFHHVLSNCRHPQ
jgi:hypothetical protein